MSHQLQYLDVGLVDQQVCEDDYHDLGWTIDMSNICSGVLGRTVRLLRILLITIYGSIIKQYHSNTDTEEF